MALQILRELGRDSADEIVQRTVGYLVATLDRAHLTWRIIPPAAAASPHAPWWDQSGRDDAFAGFRLNPTAELLGYLHDYRDLVPDEMLADVTDAVIAHIEAAKTLEMHELLCCTRLAESAGLSAPLRERVIAVVSRHISAAVAAPGEWEGYDLRPVQVADSPDSPFLAVVRDTIEQSLDFEIATQRPDGTWGPNWAWGDRYPEAWEQAQREWTGTLTFDKLMLLKRFGRIAAPA